METQVIPKDPALAALADTQGPLRRMALLAIVGLAIWIVLLGWLAVWLLAEAPRQPLGGLFAWSIIGLPVLLHIWPIRRLLSASRELAAFAAGPSDASAAAAIRAQRGYWRAAAISHAIIVGWFLVVLLVIIAGPGSDMVDHAWHNAGKEASSHGAR